MGQLKRPRKRSFPCNPKLFSDLRERKGWTQYELAVASGYSERLINKAESGRPISRDAIEILAEALSLPGEPITFDDLICDQVSLAKEYMTALYTHQANIMPAIRHFLSEEVVFLVAGDPKEIPFAGEHRGIDEVDAALRIFFSLLQAPAHLDRDPQMSYVSQGRDVIIWGESWLHPIGVPLEKPMMISHRMTFHKGKLIRFENVFDTLYGAQLLNESSSQTTDTESNGFNQG